MSKFRETISILIISILTIIEVTGCYEPSDIDAFDSGEPAIVIEGLITDFDSTCSVIVSQSVAPTDSVNCTFINNATVVIRDDLGNSAKLQNIGNGKYLTKDIIGKPGHEYLLTIEIDESRYNSIERMPKSIIIDSIIVEYQSTRTIFDTIGYYISIFTPKTEDSVLYYRIEIERNNTLLDGYSNLWIYEDNHKTDIFQMNIPQNFETGDSLTIKIYSLTKPIYEYYFGLSKQFNINFSNIQPPLTNPESNINPTALGYFQASTVNSFHLIVGNEMRKVVKIKDTPPQ